MRLAGVAIRNLAQRPVRSLLTIASVAMAIAAFVSLVGLARGLEQALVTSLESRGTDFLAIEASAPDLISSVVPIELAKDIAELPGIDATSAELTRIATLADGNTVGVVGWPADGYLWQTLTVVDGRLPQPPETDRIALGKRLAARLGLEPGDSLELFRRSLRIVGIVDSASYFNRNLVFILHGDLARYSYRLGKTTTVHVRLEPGLAPERRAEIVERARVGFAAYSIEETADLARDNSAARIASAFSWSISIVAILFANLHILGALTMSVNERRSEIALMRAVGWRRSMIVRLIVMEAFAIALVGGAAGIAAGIGVSRFVAALPAVGGFVAPDIDPWILFNAGLATAALALVGALLPAYSAASADPASVLRGR